MYVQMLQLYDVILTGPPSILTPGGSLGQLIALCPDSLQ